MPTSEQPMMPFIEQDTPLLTGTYNENSEEIQRENYEKNEGKSALVCDRLFLAKHHGWIGIVASFICIMTISANGLPFIFKFAYLQPIFSKAYLPVSQMLSEYEVDIEIVHELKKQSDWQVNEEKKLIENVDIVNSLICHLIAPGVNALIVKFGCHRVCIAGSIVSCFAFILSSISINANVLVLTYGVIGGIGFGMIYLPALVAVGHYSDLRITLASCIAFYGSEEAMWVFIPIAHYLGMICNWLGYNLALSCLVLICALCGAFMRPLKIPKEPSPCCLKSNSEKAICSAIFDFKLLKSPIFLIICIGNLFAMASFHIPFVYLANYFKHYENYKDAQLNNAMDNAINSFGINILLRLVIGCVAYFNLIRTFILHNASVMIAGIAILVLALSDSYWSLIISAHFFVLSSSAFIYLTPSVLMNLQGLEKFTDAFGWILFFRGFGTIIGVKCAGELYDAAESLLGPLCISSALVFISSVIFCFALIFHSCFLHKKLKTLENESPQASRK